MVSDFVKNIVEGINVVILPDEVPLIPPRKALISTFVILR
jgi:hypothetical protein